VTYSCLNQKNDNMTAKLCPDCEVNMEKKCSIITETPVMGQRANAISIFQCPECKNIEVG